MQTIEQLNGKFSIDNVARFEPGHGGMPRLAIHGPAGEAHIYLHGAHVTHYKPSDQPAVLFLSGKSFFEAGKAIRGGVPICWPWFGPRDGDKTAMHGFVRTRPWDVVEVSRSGDAIKAVFTTSSSELTRGVWNHDFKLRFVVTVGSQLTMELDTTNTSSTPFQFEEALHSYFAVADVRQIAIDGLTGASYVDKNNLGPEKLVDHDNPLRIKGPVDRVYVNTPSTCTIEDPVLRRRITIAKDNSISTVVWNPWSDKIATFVDLVSEDWPKFMCIESCNVRDNAVTLRPGESHILRVRLRSEAM